VALVELKREVGADRVLFMGDDVTDETAFATLGPGDFGVHVGLGPSLADVTVPDPSTLADLLDILVALRAGE
jgi:trehalose-6-phosphatase